MTLDRGPHVLLGDRRDDGADHGECAWTLLSDTMWNPGVGITRLERMAYPGGIFGDVLLDPEPRVVTYVRTDLR